MLRGLNEGIGGFQGRLGELRLSSGRNSDRVIAVGMSCVLAMCLCAHTWPASMSACRPGTGPWGPRSTNTCVPPGGLPECSLCLLLPLRALRPGRHESPLPWAPLSFLTQGPGQGDVFFLHLLRPPPLLSHDSPRGNRTRAFTFLGPRSPSHCGSKWLSVPSSVHLKCLWGEPCYPSTSVGPSLGLPGSRSGRDCGEQWCSGPSHTSDRLDPGLLQAVKTARPQVC